jgi:hypothetical protein
MDSKLKINLRAILKKCRNIVYLNAFPHALCDVKLLVTTLADGCALSDELPGYF